MSELSCGHIKNFNHMLVFPLYALTVLLLLLQQSEELHVSAAVQRTEWKKKKVVTSSSGNISWRFLTTEWEHISGVCSAMPALFNGSCHIPSNLSPFAGLFVFVWL